MSKYFVEWSHYEEVKDLHCEAASPEEALRMWTEMFGEDYKGSAPKVAEVTKANESFWKRDGHTVVLGQYPDMWLR